MDAVITYEMAPRTGIGRSKGLEEETMRRNQLTGDGQREAYNPGPSLFYNIFFPGFFKAFPVKLY
jgi:hypothetical protein